MIRTLPACATIVAAAAISILAACARDPAPRAAAREPLATAPSPSHVPTPVDVEGVHNAFWLGPGIMSGSQPEGEVAFESLAQHGIRTLVSVDGAAPDAEAAERHGIRTVHLPIGYDGIPRDRQLELLRVAQDLEGPIFVHCHHGKHRGPAAASIIAVGDQGWTGDEAVAAMQSMGTAPEYAGLYACVAAFAPPSTSELERADASFPARTPVSDMAEAMVHVDERWESLKLAKATGWKAIPDHPDIDPPHEALMLKETFREIARADGQWPAGFVEESERMEKAAADLEAAIRAGNVEAANAAFGAGAASCKACHVDYRNVTGVLEASK